MRGHLSILTALLLVVGILSACSGKTKEKTNVIELSLDQVSFPITPWKADASQMTTVHGKLQVDGSPVSHASVQIGNNRTFETDDSGSFEIQVDRSKPLKLPVRITKVDQATLSGKAIEQEVETKLLAASTELTVFYPIKITQVQDSSKNPDLVEIHGLAQVLKDASFPTFLIDKYSILGVVKDAAGKPVENAVVNIRRSGVEGYAKSEPSNSNGEYSMIYVPEEDEETQLLVHVGNTQYTLPENKIYHLQEDTSMEINITLPKEGTIITDAPPTLVTRTVPGAFYKGTLIGLKVSDEIVYTSTIPKQDGTFTMTLPKKVWEQNPAFFETEMSLFSQKFFSPGDELPSTFIQKPGPMEPDHIIATLAP